MAVHAGKSPRRQPAAAMAVPRGGTETSRREFEQCGRRAAARFDDRRTGAAMGRTPGPERILGLGACPGGRGRRQQRCHSGGLARFAGAVAFEAAVSAHPGARQRLHRLRGSRFRTGPESRARHTHRENGIRDAGAGLVDTARTADRVRTDPAARLLPLGIPFGPAGRFRVDRQESEGRCAGRSRQAQDRHQPALSRVGRDGGGTRRRAAADLAARRLAGPGPRSAAVQGQSRQDRQRQHHRTGLRPRARPPPSTAAGTPRTQRSIQRAQPGSISSMSIRAGVSPPPSEPASFRSTRKR